MANTDSIEVVGPASLSELATVVAAAVGAPLREAANGLPFVDLDAHTVARIVPDRVPGEQYPYFLDIDGSAAAPDSHRMAVSRRLYELLVERTEWGLRYASDDSAENPIARRPLVARAG